MKARRSGSSAHILATRGIAWFVALACIVLVGLEFSRIVSDRSEVIAGARKDTANLTSSLLQNAELTFRTADAILLGVVERVEHEPLNDDLRNRLKAWFVKEVENSTQFVAFGVLDEHGTILVNMLGEEPAGAFADRDYFLYHRSHNDDRLRIGRPVAANCRANGSFRRRGASTRPTARSAASPVAAINPRYFQDIYDRLDIGKDSAIMLVTTDGALLVRRPFAEANIGRDMTSSSIFTQLLQAPSGSFEIKATIDGVPRYISYERGSTYPIFVSVAQDMEELMAPWRMAAHPPADRGRSDRRLDDIDGGLCLARHQEPGQ